MNGSGEIVPGGLGWEGSGVRVVGQAAAGDVVYCASAGAGQAAFKAAFSTLLNLNDGGCISSVVVAPPLSASDGGAPTLAVRAAAQTLENGQPVVLFAGVLEGTAKVEVLGSTTQPPLSLFSSPDGGVAVFGVRAAVSATAGSLAVAASVIANTDGAAWLTVGGIDPQVGGMRLIGTTQGTLIPQNNPSLAVAPFGPAAGFVLSLDTNFQAQGAASLQGDVSDRLAWVPRFALTHAAAQSGAVAFAGRADKAFLVEERLGGATVNPFLLVPTQGLQPAFVSRSTAEGLATLLAVPGPGAQVELQGLHPLGNGDWLLAGEGAGEVKFGAAVACDGTLWGGTPRQLAGPFLRVLAAADFEKVCPPAPSQVDDFNDQGTIGRIVVTSPVPSVLGLPGDLDCYALASTVLRPATLHYKTVNANGACTGDTVVTAWMWGPGSTLVPYCADASCYADDVDGSLCASGWFDLSDSDPIFCVSGFAGQPVASVLLTVTVL